MASSMSKVSKEKVIVFFIKEIKEFPSVYIDCGEINSTALAEVAQQRFGVMTDEGKSPIEQQIFDWAAEYAIGWELRRLIPA